jgi:hypothetical protein
MSAGSAWKREVRVAFSLKAQPVWFRVLKWAVFIVLGALFWRSPLFWYCVLGVFALAVVLHMFWRRKTKGWTQAWGGWDDLEAGRQE